jgi:hypothetical protein
LVLGAWCFAQWRLKKTENCDAVRRTPLDSHHSADKISLVSYTFSAAAAEFLESYQRDTPLRWSPADLAAQQHFVNVQVAGDNWLDWSTPSAAWQLAQASHAQVPVATPETSDAVHAVLLAGPMVELLEPSALFRQAREPVGPDGRLIGIIPCLRDNSPESDRFIQLAREALWPYYTAEELLEVLRESGWQIEPQVGGFVSVPAFNRAVLDDQLAFKGFNRVFARLSAEGYDPMEVGWGELRFVARVASDC